MLMPKSAVGAVCNMRSLSRALPNPRAHPYCFAKRACEMCLICEADDDREFGERKDVLDQELLGTGDACLDDPLMGRYAFGNPESPTEMRARESN